MTPIIIQPYLGRRLPKELILELHAEWVGSLPGEVSLTYYKQGSAVWGQIGYREDLYDLWWKTVKRSSKKGQAARVQPRFHASVDKAGKSLRLGKQV